MLVSGVLRPPSAIKGDYPPSGMTTRNLVDEAGKGRGDTEGEEKEAPIKVVVLVVTRRIDITQNGKGHQSFGKPRFSGECHCRLGRHSSQILCRTNGRSREIRVRFLFWCSHHSWLTTIVGFGSLPPTLAFQSLHRLLPRFFIHSWKPGVFSDGTFRQELSCFNPISPVEWAPSSK